MTSFDQHDLRLFLYSKTKETQIKQVVIYQEVFGVLSMFRKTCSAQICCLSCSL